MAPEQGPSSAGACAKNLTSTNTAEAGSPNTPQPTDDTRASESNTNTLNVDSLSWIYLLKKEKLIEECKRHRIFVEGYTVADLRNALSAYVKAKRHRKSTEDLLRDLEEEIKAEEERPVKMLPSTIPTVRIDNYSPPPLEMKPATKRGEINDAELMNTVRRWDVHFSGGDALHDFLERIEELAECYRIPLDNLLPTLPEVLRGKALQWFRVRKPQLHSWAAFRAEIERFFLPRRHMSQLEDAIRQRRQQSREKAKDYILALQTLIRQHPTMCGEDHLERIYDGLRVEYRLFVKRGEFKTIEELMDLTDEFELLKGEEARNSRQAAHSLAPLEERYSREESCWRCKGRGHLRFRCRRTKRLFCSRCGRDNVLSRDCPCNTATAKPPRKIRSTGTAPIAAVPVDTNTHQGGKADGRYYINVSVEGMSVRALLDTGATLTYIDESIRQHLEERKIQHRPNHRNVQLADQTCVSSLYTYPVRIMYNKRATTTLASALPNLAERMILGMDFLRDREAILTLDGQPLLAPSPAGPRAPECEPSIISTETGGPPNNGDTA
ncbi:PREDICTED: uncharacterized protein LOC108375906 isoform X2 [Rhagoletis zephyria]|uniref:uncharacterized protein LOC108375906 isoform X2 n=1 Tax=Rhagoletis zephyria TaxID=28612 RepID=UPI0008115D48|nr:PREDICTED: uncharacterized protein LOC108375906 isoform X2 [Rhagoletis zephyria]